MIELGTALSQVVTPATIIAALVAGIGMGYVIVGRYAADPAYASLTATGAQIARLVLGLSVFTGLVFYVGQAMAAYAEDDFGWARIVSRYALWIVYSIALSLGVWARVSRHIRVRRRAAHEIAAAEIERQR